MAAKTWATAIMLLVAATASQGRDQDRCRSAEVVDVPFQLQSGRVISIDGKVGTADHQTIIVDTGLYWTVIDRGLAQQLGLSGSGDSMLVTPNDVLTLPTVIIPELRVSSLVIRSLPAVVMDLMPFRERTKIQANVFLGMHVLTRSSATLDFAHSKLKFTLVHCTGSR